MEYVFHQQYSSSPETKFRISSFRVTPKFLPISRRLSSVITCLGGFPPVAANAMEAICAAFSMVCISPNAVSKSGPDTNNPWNDQTAASNFSISTQVAFAISGPPWPAFRHLFLFHAVGQVSAVPLMPALSHTVMAHTDIIFHYLYAKYIIH